MNESCSKITQRHTSDHVNDSIKNKKDDSIYKSYQTPSKGQLIKLAKMSDELCSSPGSALGTVLRMQNKTPEYMVSRLPDTSKALWENLIDSKLKTRPSSLQHLHVVAVCSLICNVPMTALIIDVNEKPIPGMDMLSLKASIFAGYLPRKKFTLIIKHLSEILSYHGFKHGEDVYRNYLDNASCYPDYKATEGVIKLEEFAKSYHRSLGENLIFFREYNNYTQQFMADALGILLSTYRKLESGDIRQINALVVVRLKYAFRLPDTVLFIKDMYEFPEFIQSRRVQQFRENILFDMMRPLPDEKKNTILNLFKLYYLEN